MVFLSNIVQKAKEAEKQEKKGKQNQIEFSFFNALVIVIQGF